VLTIKGILFIKYILFKSLTYSLREKLNNNRTRIFPLARQQRWFFIHTEYFAIKLFEYLGKVTFI
jgi:hypothetical protein